MKSQEKAFEFRSTKIYRS